MNYQHIKNGIIISVILFCILLIIAAVQFNFYNEVSSYIYKLTSLSVSFAIIMGLHIWSTSYTKVVGLQKLLLLTLNVEILFTFLLTTILIFSWYDFYKTLIMLLSFQAGHGIIYLSNMFLYDEKPVHHKPLTDKEIMMQSKKITINPSLQECED